MNTGILSALVAGLVPTGPRALIVSHPYLLPTPTPTPSTVAEFRRAVVPSTSGAHGRPLRNRDKINVRKARRKRERLARAAGRKARAR